jgi:hypothetical protein
MKGIVFNLLEHVVTRHHGEDAWDALLEQSHLSGAYTSLGSYPDEHAVRLVAAAASSLEIPASEVLRWFGREALPLLAERYPHFFEPHCSARPLLLSLNGIIHPEVRKLYPGAQTPVFEFESLPNDELLVCYSSPRRMCALVHGFIEGVAAHYHETVQCAHVTCMQRDDEKCRLQIAFD